MAEQRERMRAQLAFYASTPTYRTVLDLHAWQAVGEQLGQLAKRQRWADMPALISDEMLETFAVTAPPDDVGAVLRARYVGLSNRLTLYLPFEPGQDDAFWRTTLRACST